MLVYVDLLGNTAILAAQRGVIQPSPSSGAKLSHTKNFVSAVSGESYRAGVFDFCLVIADIYAPDKRIQKCLLVYDVYLI